MNHILDRLCDFTELPPDLKSRRKRLDERPSDEVLPIANHVEPNKHSVAFGLKQKMLPRVNASLNPEIVIQFRHDSALLRR